MACVVRSADDQCFTTFRTSRTESSPLLAQHQPAVVLIDAWEFTHLKRKPDKDDAQRLTEVYRLASSPP